jgi:hypothetical protein
MKNPPCRPPDGDAAGDDWTCLLLEMQDFRAQLVCGDWVREVGHALK